MPKINILPRKTDHQIQGWSCSDAFFPAATYNNRAKIDRLAIKTLLRTIGCCVIEHISCRIRANAHIMFASNNDVLNIIVTESIKSNLT